MTDARHGTRCRRRSRTTPTACIEFARAGVVGVALSERGARPPASSSTRSPTTCETRPRPACDRRRPRLPADDKFAQLTRALWSQGVLLDVPAGRPLDRPIVIRWARRRRRIAPSSPGRSSASATARRRRSSRSWSRRRRTPRRRRAARLLRRHDRGHASAPRPRSRSRASRSSARRPSRSSTGTRSSARARTLHWALAQLGGRLVRSRVDNRLDGDRSSVEQVEIVFGADEQLFDLTSYTRHIGRDTTGNLLSKGALLEKRADLPQGPDHDREERRRHRQLPRRVRDEPARRRPARSRSRRSRSTSPTAAGRCTRARSGRSTRPSCSTSRAAASRPTRRASSSSSASSSRSWPASRSRRPRTGCASCSRRSGRPAPTASTGVAAA